MSLSTNKPTSTSSTLPIDRMNNYKGGLKPFSLYIRVAGGTIGTLAPFAIAGFLPRFVTEQSDRTETVLIVLQAWSLSSVLFLGEFVLGVKARTISAKAAFSPAAAQMNSNEPFEVVEANRIHQNHIESACVYLPSVLAAAAAGADANLLVASTFSWVLARVLYRWGYCVPDNPMWRLFGTVMSLSQSFLCLGLFVYQKVK